MGLLNWLRDRGSSEQTSVPAEPISYVPIGVVSNRQRDPQGPNWDETPSSLIFRSDLSAALDAVDGFSHLIVLFHLNRVPPGEARASVTVSGIERGVLATRSQLRPNPIGMAVVRLIDRRKDVLRVRGLDALDGTPVLDIKPYLPPYDSVSDAELPDWATAPKAE